MTGDSDSHRGELLTILGFAVIFITIIGLAVASSYRDHLDRQRLSKWHRQQQLEYIRTTHCPKCEDARWLSTGSPNVPFTACPICNPNGNREVGK